MERIAILREQASVLRALAASFDIPLMRDQLLDVAARCDAIARSLEENPQSADIKPPASADPRPEFFRPIRGVAAGVYASSTMSVRDGKTADPAKH